MSALPERLVPVAGESAMLAYLADVDRDAWLFAQFILAAGAEVARLESGDLALRVPDKVRYGVIGQGLRRELPALQLALRAAAEGVAVLERRQAELDRLRPALIVQAPAEKPPRLRSIRVPAGPPQPVGDVGVSRPTRGLSARLGAAWAVLTNRDHGGRS